MPATHDEVKMNKEMRFYNAEDFESVLPETWGRIAAEQCATAANAKRDAEIVSLQETIERLRTENAELGKVYRSTCPQCGYGECVRGAKVCDDTIKHLETENTRLREALELFLACNRRRGYPTGVEWAEIIGAARAVLGEKK
jgi:hypothetical protein